MGACIMAEKKRQHYVPKFYMRNFANSDGLFMVYQIAKKQTFGPVSHKTQCYKNYFYGDDCIWENKLAQMESAWNTAFKKAILSDPLSPDDIHAFKQFALYQRHRTVAENVYLQQEYEDLLVECGKAFYENNGWLFNDAAKKLCKSYAQSKATPIQNLKWATSCLHLIEDLSIVIINYNTRKSLISSDVPVIAINQFHSPSIGYSCMGLILLYPITPHHLVVLYDSKMYPKYRESLYINSADEKEVAHLNSLQFISAEKILFYLPDSNPISFSEPEWNTRKVNREQHALTPLENQSHKLLVTTPRKTIYQCDLSFGQVCHRFKRIPFICKEAPPRKWDEGWEKKLKLKAQVLLELSKRSPQLLTEHQISRKELRKGCERMFSATTVYWNTK